MKTSWNLGEDERVELIEIIYLTYLVKTNH
jgi:hypothetical protein